MYLRTTSHSYVLVIQVGIYFTLELVPGGAPRVSTDLWAPQFVQAAAAVVQLRLIGRSKIWFCSRCPKIKMVEHVSTYIPTYLLCRFPYNFKQVICIPRNLVQTRQVEKQLRTFISNAAKMRLVSILLNNCLVLLNRINQSPEKLLISYKPLLIK